MRSTSADAAAISDSTKALQVRHPGGTVAVRSCEPGKCSFEVNTGAVAKPGRHPLPLPVDSSQQPDP